MTLAIEREDLIGERSGISDSETGKQLPIEKAWDITSLCTAPKGIYYDMALLSYITATAEGQMAHLCKTRDGDRLSGTRCLFSIQELREEQERSTWSVGKMAQDLGINPDLLREIILAHARKEDWQTKVADEY